MIVLDISEGPNVPGYAQCGIILTCQNNSALVLMIYICM